MKSRINNIKTKCDLPYPKLMIYKNDNTIVLMTEPEIDVVVYSDDKDYPTGHYGEDWNGFRDFDGEVTISN